MVIWIIEIFMNRPGVHLQHIDVDGSRRNTCISATVGFCMELVLFFLCRLCSRPDLSPES